MARVENPVSPAGTFYFDCPVTPDPHEHASAFYNENLSTPPRTERHASIYEQQETGINPLYELSQRDGTLYHVLRANNKVVLSDKIPSPSYRFASWRSAVSRSSQSSGAVTPATSVNDEDQVDGEPPAMPDLNPTLRRSSSSSLRLFDRITHPKKLHLVERLYQTKSLPADSSPLRSSPTTVQPVSLPPTPPASEHGYRAAAEEDNGEVRSDRASGTTIDNFNKSPTSQSIPYPDSNTQPIVSLTTSTPARTEPTTPKVEDPLSLPAFLYPPNRDLQAPRSISPASGESTLSSDTSRSITAGTNAVNSKKPVRRSRTTLVISPGMEQGSSIASTSKQRRQPNLVLSSGSITDSTSTSQLPGRALSHSPSTASYFGDFVTYQESLRQQQQGGQYQPSDQNVMTPSADQDFEDSIAKEADEIRRERQSKKLEKEKQQQALDKQREKILNRSKTFRRQEPPLEEDAISSTANRAMPKEGTNVPVKQRRLSDHHRLLTGFDDRPIIGNLIGEDHVNFVLMYNMLTGIRIGVSRCQAKMQRSLTDEDYTAQHKFSFDIVGNELTPSAKYDFKFKDYAPWVFRELREHFMLDPADYLLSLTAKYILSELGSPGKSGSFFYFSRDYRFIIKTIHYSEHKFLRKILKQYYDHVKANPHTLISRFYGLHRVKLPHGRKIHFVIMNNLMPPHRDVHETYDLKGSTVSREYPEDRAAQNPSATLKDLNWIHRDKHLELGPEKKTLFLEQLKQDSQLLKRLRIMDYSLLIGIHDITRGNKDKLREGSLTVFNPDTTKLRRRQTQIKREREQDASEVRKAVERSDPKAIGERDKLPDKDRSERRHFIFYQDEGGLRATTQTNEPIDTIYYLGIIDILTPYGIRKALENFFKGFVHDKHAISPVPPQEYGNRFAKFITSIIRKSPEELAQMKEKEHEKGKSWKEKSQ